MELRIGQILIDQGVLSESQVAKVLEHQRKQAKPFGLLCEQLFNVPSEDIENAWAAQYARITRTVDPSIECFDAQAKDLITRRQAWQFCVLPIRFDDSELMIATTQMHLRKALRFASNTLPMPVYFVMAHPRALGEALCRHYALPGMTPASILDNGIERLFSPYSKAG